MTKDAKKAWDIALDIINTEDFDVLCEYHNTYFIDNDGLENEPGWYFRLVDMQGANLGGIEQDYYDNMAEIIDRLEIYHEDYFLYDEDDLGEAHERKPNQETTWRNDYLKFLYDMPIELLDRKYIEDHKDDEDLVAILEHLSSKEPCRYSQW